MAFKLILWGGFILISIGLVYISRASLRAPRSHGFYRFFAWEVILALLVLNLPVWFLNPLAWHQLLSWVLLVISLFLVIHSLIYLRNAGEPQGSRQDPSLLSLEKTTSLVTSGAYRYIRHPLYSSLLFLGWGTFFKAPSWPGVLLAAAGTILLTITAHIEEEENIRFFGPPYRIYMNGTKMFVPFLF
jgi:protein-S-isoprenylcysteine O-methyltransferase Ste14